MEIFRDRNEGMRAAATTPQTSEMYEQIESMQNVQRQDSKARGTPGARAAAQQKTARSGGSAALPFFFPSSSAHRSIPPHHAKMINAAGRLRMKEQICR